MSIILNYKATTNRKMSNALHKLGQHPGFEPKLALKIAKMCDGFYEMQEKIEKEWIKLVKENSELDEKGEFKEKEGPDGKPITGSFIPKDAEAWDKIAKEFGEKEFKLDADRIPLTSLKGVGLTAYEMKQIEPLTTDTKLTLT